MTGATKKKASKKSSNRIRIVRPNDNEAPPPPKVLPTEIVVVLDRSGSMSNMVTDAKGGFATMIEEQKKLGQDCLVTLVQFDDQHEMVYGRKKITEVPPLELVPRGSTALLDAIGRTIHQVEAGLKMDPYRKVIFVIITDGQENASVEFNLGQVRKLIEGQKDWSFLFLGANIDAFAEGGLLGIDAGFTVQLRDNAKMDSGIAEISNMVMACRLVPDPLDGKGQKPKSKKGRRNTKSNVE